MNNNFLENLYFSKSKIFLFAMGAFILGIAGHSFFGIKIFGASYFIFIIFLFGLMALIVFWDKRVFRFWGLVIICLFFGFWRFDASIPPRDKFHIDFYNNQDALLTGVVETVPETAVNKTKFTLGTRTLADKPVIGDILITLPGEKDLEYGDLARMQCKLTAPKSGEDFDYAGYLSRFNIYSVCSFVSGLEVVGKNQGNPVLSIVYKLREVTNNKINDLLLPPSSSFLAGLLLGERASMPESLRSDFLRSGTMHIIAISGWNITMVLALLGQTLIFLGLRRKTAFFISIAGIIFYVILTGAQASVVRAGIMGLLPLLAMQVGRQNNPRNVIALAAAAMLLQNPRLVAFDMGFMLSFAAILGLFYISPIIKKYFEFIPKFFALQENVVSTISAIVATSPLILYMNGSFSLVAPLANIMVLPFVPLAMALGTLAVGFGFVWFWFGEIFAWASQAVLGYIMFVLHTLAAPRFAMIQVGKVGLPAVVAIYLIIIGIFWSIKNRQLNFRHAA